MSSRLQAGALVLAGTLAWSVPADGRRAIDPTRVESVEPIRSTSHLGIGNIEGIPTPFKWAATSGPQGPRFLVPGSLELADGFIQDPRAEQGTTATFVCGEDERIPRIPLHWTNVVLAGDGRLYAPCLGVDANHPPEHREVREATVIGEGRFSADDELRWRGAQAEARNSTRPEAVIEAFLASSSTRALLLAQVDGLGGFTTGLTVLPACNNEVQLSHRTTNPRPFQPGRLFFMLGESRERVVRTRGVAQPARNFNGAPVAKEGAYAIGVLLSRPGLDANIVTAATKELRGCFIVLGGYEVAGLILENLGLARYEKEDDITETENLLAQESNGTVLKMLGAVKGLEALLRQHPQHQIGDNARIRLRELVRYGVRATEPFPLDTDARIRRLALLALQHARDRDYSALRNAVTDRDWQARRIAARSLELSDSEEWRLGELLATDTAFQVRYDLLFSLGRLAARTGQCAPIVARFKDPSPIVIMHAMDVLVPTCTDLDEATARLIDLAHDLASPDERNWHIPSRALATLARIKPAEARPRLAAAVKHPIWQVRAAAAAASVTLANEEAAVTLSRDREPNVQTAALDALSRLRSAAVVPRAIDVLKNGDDYQLLRMAALVLRGLPREAKNEASDALLIALRKVTAEETDTSRDTRVAILDRLTETLNPTRSSDLLPFVGDYDDDVKEAAIKAFTALVHAPPAPASPRRRYPFQPQPEALSSLPSQASIQLQEGTVTLRLLPDVAPVTIARFAALARQGYYNGLTFHRVVPNFIVQGGSPGGNDYSGATRYMRDEVGPQAVHVRGAVGMSKRGTDTGDGQFFIDLVDLPHLDRNYTVFAYVTQGMEFVDRLLDGAKIVNVSVK